MKVANMLGERFKNAPKDCVIESHALMMRGGYMKYMANGIFSLFTPAKRIMRKIEQIIREEMDAVDGQEVMFPVAMPASLAPTFLKMDFSILGTVNFITVIFAFLFVDTFDTLGTVIGCASRADMLDEEGKLPEIRGVLLADAIGTTVGAAMGTSTVTTFVESSSGIVEGGRTGLTAITSALLFLSAVFFSPLFLAIPSAATAPAFVMVGFLMMQQITKIDWNGELSEAVPSFITIFAMPFLYSISEGISFGIISYVLMNLVMGKTKKITPLMYVLAVIFILKYVIL